ncbi:hypothetical protein A0H76_152 [Hepatospora eriocheir]|uniref:Uncharacterized protein n=1 Tax=Hepatospora eriocheir TaxID=1081669 RepID=A0A1X0QEH8_9MICR|nr:hypothetical protein A0H76_152 [Hepatospora eriocheir]
MKINIVVCDNDLCFNERDMLCLIEKTEEKLKRFQLEYFKIALNMVSFNNLSAIKNVFSELIDELKDIN